MRGMIVIAWKMISLPVPGRRTEQINFGYSDETLAWRARPVRAQCLADSYRNWRAKAGSRGASATSSLLGLGPCNAFCNTAGGWFRNRLSIAATAFLAFTGRARARQKCSRPVFTLSFSRVPAAATAASGFANSRRLHTHTYRSRFANESISTARRFVRCWRRNFSNQSAPFYAPNEFSFPLRNSISTLTRVSIFNTFEAEL